MENVEIDADQIWHFAWTYIKTVVDTVRQPFLILDKDLRVISANNTFYKFFGTKTEETEGKLVYELGDGQWDIPNLRILLEDILPHNSHFEDFKVEHEFETVGKKIMILNARRVYIANDKRQIILLAMDDITKQVKLEEQLTEYAEKITSEVVKKTMQLERRIKDLEKLNKIMQKRELKYTALKNEVESLKKVINKNSSNKSTNKT